jgi:hypothetical protein
MWTGGVAQVIERLHSNREALSTNPSTAKKKKKNYMSHRSSINSKVQGKLFPSYFELTLYVSESFSLLVFGQVQVRSTVRHYSMKFRCSPSSRLQ